MQAYYDQTQKLYDFIAHMSDSILIPLNAFPALNLTFSAVVSISAIYTTDSSRRTRWQNWAALHAFIKEKSV